MFQEALKWLEVQVQAASNPKPIPVPDPRSVRYSANGKIEMIELPLPPRKHEVGTLDEIIALAARFAADGASDTDGDIPTPVAWYDAEKVVLVLDDGGFRLDTATLTLVESDVFEQVRRLAEKPQWMSQKDFIRLLRVELAGTLNPELLLNIVRKCKFEQGATTDGHVQHAKESIGRAIRAEVATSGGQIPEGVFLQVPVYSTPGETDRYPLGCAVEVEPEQISAPFRLVPLPDEIEHVSTAAVVSIGKRLKAGLPKGVGCYFGSP